MGPAIRVEGLFVQRGGQAVLNGVSFSIPAGKIIAVIGPSGVGKTTLLQTLSGLVKPCGGSISVNPGGELKTGSALRAFRRQTGMVFQEHALIGRLTAIDNVLLGLADRRHPLSLLPWLRDERYRAALALNEMGLLHRATVRADRLSGGERQRVGIARALVREPALLLADEPFASVDPALVAQLSQSIRRRVKTDGMTAVLVMHQLETALSLADHLIALADGQVAFAGSPDAFDDHTRAWVFRRFGGP
ncbi:MAG: ATP-binding cassette domain-containing protein [Methylococcus sp.]|nr:ATP-binding cassette domain-containing protein [Methylococcus sp.]